MTYEVGKGCGNTMKLDELIASKSCTVRYEYMASGVGLETIVLHNRIENVGMGEGILQGDLGIPDCYTGTIWRIMKKATPIYKISKVESVQPLPRCEVFFRKKCFHDRELNKSFVIWVRFN